MSVRHVNRQVTEMKPVACNLRIMHPLQPFGTDTSSGAGRIGCIRCGIGCPHLGCLDRDDVHPPSQGRPAQAGLAGIGCRPRGCLRDLAGRGGVARHERALRGRRDGAGQ